VVQLDRAQRGLHLGKLFGPDLRIQNTLRRVWEKARFKLRADYLRSDTADDRFLLVDAGYTFLPGGQRTIPR
jgi:hypothetical protein